MHTSLIDPTLPVDNRPAAVVYCEGQFARIDGKTANGLVRASEKYRIVAVIDSTLAGQDAGMVLDDIPTGIPIIASLDAWREAVTAQPNLLIFGLAPLSGLMTMADRRVVLAARRRLRASRVPCGRC